MPGVDLEARDRVVSTGYGMSLLAPSRKAHEFNDLFPDGVFATHNFDEVLHSALGLAGHDWQSLYHFTIGCPVEDVRLRTVQPYPHLAAHRP